jgi:hypothetical protein
MDQGKELTYPLADARGSVVRPDTKIVPKNKKSQGSTTNVLLFRTICFQVLGRQERSMNRTIGSSETTTIEPGGHGFRLDTNGWSIQPPASAMR